MCETAPLCIGVFLCKCVFCACALHKLALPEGCIQTSPVEQRWQEVKFLHLELFNSVDLSIGEKAFKLTLSEHASFHAQFFPPKNTHKDTTFNACE